MPEDYEAVYTHPAGATAIFTRHDGSLDAVARGLDSEQFWVFKNVKALLVRNEEGDLTEANRLMASIGFTASVRRLELASVGARGASAAAGGAFAVTTAPAYGEVEEEHGHQPHAPAPSYWPAITGFSVGLGLCGLILVNSFPFLAGIGLIMTFISMVGWGLEPFEA